MPFFDAENRRRKRDRARLDDGHFVDYLESDIEELEAELAQSEARAESARNELRIMTGIAMELIDKQAIRQVNVAMSYMAHADNEVFLEVRDVVRALMSCHRIDRCVPQRR